MPCQLTKSNFSESFFDSLQRTHLSIDIVSPFIGRQLSVALCEFLSENPNVKMRLITRFYREDFIKGVSSLDALEELSRAGAEITALIGLHTKLYLFDNILAIMGSANLTYGGFYTNHELSVLFSEEDEIMSEFKNYFDELWTRIKSNGDWDVTIDRIAKEKDIVVKCQVGRVEGVSKPNQSKWGAELDDAVARADEIETLLGETDSPDYQGKTAWLKFEGTGSNRIPSDATYFEIKSQRNDVERTYFPVNPSGIKAEDVLYLTVVSYDKNGRAVPMIIGKTKTNGFNAKNVVNEQELKETPWLERFPYYLELVDTVSFKHQIQYGISLLDLYRDVGNKALPTTYNNQKITAIDLQRYHKRRSHMQITTDAIEYIERKLDALFNEYGKVVIN